MELILNPKKIEQLPVGDTPNPVTYILTSLASSNAQPIQTVSTVLNLGLLLNTGLSADDKAARAAEKGHGMFFFTFVTLTRFIFLPLHKAFIYPHLAYALQASSIIPFHLR